MRILIVEDDQHKLDDLSQCALELQGNVGLSIAGSVQMAVQHVAESLFDLVILDMSLPSHTVRAGDSPPSPMLSGGIEVLMELSYRGRKDRVVVVTQYPEIEIEGVLVSTEKALPVLADSIYSGVAGVIRYDRRDGRWRRMLSDSIRAL